MTKVQHYAFDAVVDGHLNQRNIEMLKVYKKAIDELAETMTLSELKETILYQMYFQVLVQTFDYLMEV